MGSGKCRVILSINDIYCFFKKIYFENTQYIISHISHNVCDHFLALQKKKKFGQKIVHFSDTLDFYNNFSFLKLEN